MRLPGRFILAALCGLAISSHAAGGQEAPLDCARGGLLEGRVVNANSGVPLDSASVSVQWVQVKKRKSDIDLLPVSTRATMDGAHYRVCGLPLNAAVRIRVNSPGYAAVDGEIVLAAMSGARRDFRLVPAALKQGTGIVSGHVVRTDGASVNSGSVVIRALGRDARIVDGRFSIDGIPTGSWAIEARSLGYTPGGVIIDVGADTVASATIVLVERVHVLAGVTVTGMSSEDVRTLNYVLARKRVGFGTFVLPGDRRLVQALDLADVVKMAPGFRRGKDTIEARAVGPGRCVPTVYVDGMRNPAYLQIDEVLAVAAFPDMTGVPVEYRDQRNCAVILVWMKK
jgi:hypothetical protein